MRCWWTNARACGRCASGRRSGCWSWRERLWSSGGATLATNMCNVEPARVPFPRIVKSSDPFPWRMEISQSSYLVWGKAVMTRLVVWILSRRIAKINRVIPRISVQVRPIHQPGRISRCPASEPGRVVARAVVVESGLLVALLAGVAVALEAGLRRAASGLVGRAAVGIVLLVGDDLAVLRPVPGWPSRGGCRAGSG